VKDPRVIVTPHNAFNSTEALQRIMGTTKDNVIAFIDGSPINTVE
jgi:D-lactate dehydrogenase